MATNARPDSCKSWMIALAGFVINFLLSGVSRSSGIFYVALIKNYGISRMEANLPFTLRGITRNVLGPLVGVIGQRYGSRGVTIAGGLFAAAGIASCSFASNIIWVTLLWGGIHGTGVALGNTLYQITLNRYFEKYRATASGISSSGACVGSFVFPILFEYLLSDIGLSGTFLLTGSFMLHVVPAGMLMKEPSWIEQKPKISNAEHSSLKSDNHRCPGKLRGNDENHVKTEEIFVLSYKRIPSNHDICNWKQQEEMWKNANVKNFHKNFPSQTTVETLKKDDTTLTSPKKKFSIYRETLLMICNPMFHVISLSLASLIVLYDMCLTIIIDYMKDKGIPENDGKYFILFASVGDFVGRLGFGWVTDRKYLSLSKYMMLLNVIQGCTFGMIPFINSFYILMILVVICNTAGGASNIMYPILVAKHLSSVQSLAMGSTCFIGGIVALGVPPMIGYFRDTVGSYDSLYFVLGTFAIITGFLWCLESLLVKIKWKEDSKIVDKLSQM